MPYGYCALRLLLNTPDDPHVSIARTRVPPGVTTRLHRLKGIVERYAILSGTGRVEVDGQAPREVAAGDTVAIPAMHSQRIANSGEVDLVFLAVCTPRFTKDAYEDLDSGQALRGTSFT